jgi:archaeal flagellar protein FlaJ
MAIKIYEMVGRIFSRSQTRQLGNLLEASGLDFVPEAFAGFVVLICAIFSLVAYLLVVDVAPLRSFIFRLAFLVSKDLVASSPDFFTSIAVVSSIVIGCGAVCLAAYVSLLLMADERRRKVEDVLPDFLSLSAANVRAGMTIDQAMWYAAKPEFGILSDEVATVAKKAFGGVPFNQAIDGLTDRFNSKSVRRTVALIKQGIASGGKLADILERTAEDTREMQVLRKEISTSLLMYVIFIVFAGAIGTPFLFAISSKLVGIIEGVFSTQQFADVDTSAYSTSLVMPSKPLITSAEFFIFTMLSCAMTAVFSSLIIGVISKGSKKDGVAYLPFLLIGSMTIFFVVSYLLDTLLANIYI